jgi:hypothetical protein
MPTGVYPRTEELKKKLQEAAQRRLERQIAKGRLHTKIRSSSINRKRPVTLAPVTEEKPMTDHERREAVEKIIANAANHVRGQNQPHMSGDPRRQLLPYQQAIVKDAAIAVTKVMDGEIEQLRAEIDALRARLIPEP